MVCSKCGQELKDGAKFCTKCGAKFNAGLTSKPNILSYLSLITSVVSIVGLIIVLQIRRINGGYITLNIHRFFYIFRLSLIVGIILAIIALYKQKCKLAFIAGLTPCAYFILAILPGFLPFLRFLSRIFVY